MPANLGWDDSVDGPALCEKLTALSEPDLPRLITESPMIRWEPVRGLALFLRASLSYEAARPREAAEELLDLMYSGENRAWLASLCGNLPEPHLQEAAADLCVERLLGGSHHDWTKALGQMPAPVMESRLQTILERGDTRACSHALYLLQSGTVPVPPHLWAAIRRLSGHGDFAVSWPAQALLLTLPPDGTAERTAAQHAIEAYVREQADLDLMNTNDYLPAACLLGTEDESVVARCRELLLRPAKMQDGQAEKMGAAAAALLQLQSPLLMQLLGEFTSSAHAGPIRDTALALGRLADRLSITTWLEEALSSLPDPENLGTAALGAALGHPAHRATLWKALPAVGDRALSATLLALLAQGGDAEAVALLHVLGQAAEQALLQNAGPKDLRRAWSGLGDDLIGALSAWSRQPTELVGVRWKALLSQLRTQSRGPDDPAYFRAVCILDAMADLWRAGGCPSTGTHVLSPRVDKWLAQQAPAILSTSEIPRLCAGAGDVSLWLIERASHIGTYSPPSAAVAATRGQNPRPDDDQQHAWAQFKQDLDAAMPLTEQSRAGSAILLWTRIIETYERVPFWGSKRWKMLGEAELHLGLCFCIVMGNDEADFDTALSVIDGLPGSGSVFEKARRYAREYAGRAELHARRSGNADLIERVSLLHQEISDTDRRVQAQVRRWEEEKRAQSETPPVPPSPPPPAPRPATPPPTSRASEDLLAQARVLYRSLVRWLTP